MPTRVKICGVTRIEDADLAVELGAAALGFNFYAPSPRSIDPARARAIIRRLPPFVTTVGIFADQADADRALDVAREAGVDLLQFHGPRFPMLDGALAGFPIIRAVPVGQDFRAESLADLKAAAFLLDTFDSVLKGGTGRPFPWPVAREAKKYGAVILAGGLTPENVAEAIRQASPFAVDVASGVESAPGVKDPHKLRAFFAAVARTDHGFGDGRIEPFTGTGNGR